MLRNFLMENFMIYLSIHDKTYEISDNILTVVHDEFPFESDVIDSFVKIHQFLSRTRDQT